MARLASMLTSNYQLKLITLLVNTHSATNFLRLSPTNRVQKACQLPVVNRETRSTISTAVKKSSTGVLEAKCHFCEKKHKKHKRKKEPLYKCLTKDLEMGIRKDISDLKDASMLAKTADLDFVAKELQYHRICRLNYFNRAQAARKLATSMKDKAKSNRHPASTGCCWVVTL